MLNFPEKQVQEYNWLKTISDTKLNRLNQLIKSCPNMEHDQLRRQHTLNQQGLFILNRSCVKLLRDPD